MVPGVGVEYGGRWPRRKDYRVGLGGRAQRKTTALDPTLAHRSTITVAPSLIARRPALLPWANGIVPRFAGFKLLGSD